MFNSINIIKINTVAKYSGNIILFLLLSNTAYAVDDDIIISVTSTREAQELADIPSSIGVINKKTITKTKPAHPSEITNQIPGVYINVTGGEGHMTAIRQPTTTKAVYLYLEDGIPTRSTGFFNHNALYEVNIPQSESIEIIKGPGTSLYGSDAIGGVVNVLTAAPPVEKEASVNLELGGYGWKRLLASIGNSDDNSGYLASVNLTKSDGWRDGTEYERMSGNLRFDNFLDNGASVKTIFSSTNVEQQTAGSSKLLKDDYLNNPELNYTPISYRKVEAYRLSTAYEKDEGKSALSITPYLRHNTMELLPNWSLSYDPVVYKTNSDSLGVLVKHRKNLNSHSAVLISGVDVDYSPGSYKQNEITPTKTGNIYTSYTVGELQYNYDVVFASVSPYLHYEHSFSTKTRMTAGGRIDLMQYDYNNKLSTLTTGSHRRPSDTVVSFSHFSPKLGLIYKVNNFTSTFVNYRHAFRVPSNTQLFRQGKAENTVDLKPIKVDSVEFGLHGRTINNLSYTFSVYYMQKNDDILSFKNPDNTREIVNAGATSHQGIEVGLKKALTKSVRLDIAASYAVHRYDDWKPNSTTDYSGNEMESAPRTITNTKLDYTPSAMNDLNLEIEWVHIGRYWMDQANTQKYSGHDLVNLRTRYLLTKQSHLYARIMNITNEKYATLATYKTAAFSNPEKFEYAPGMPLTLFAGMEWTF